MPASELTLENDTFWSTVAQVSPVLAFALMLEIRRSAKGWTVGHRWGRLVQSLFYVAVMFALVNCFALALGQLVTHSASKATLALVSFALTAIATFLLLNPLIELTMRANLDWRATMRILWPGSSWWKLQFKSHKTVQRSEALVRTAENYLALADQSYLHGRREFKRVKKSPNALRPSNDATWLEEGETDEMNAARARFLERYVETVGEPLIDVYRRSRDTRRTVMREAKKNLRLCQRNLDESLDIRRQSRLFTIVGLSDDIYEKEISLAQARLDESAPTVRDMI